MLDVTKNFIILPLIFSSNNVTSKLGIFNIFKADKRDIKCALQKRNFKVLVFKSRRLLWGHDWCHKKNILKTFKGICMNFSLELNLRKRWQLITTHFFTNSKKKVKSIKWWRIVETNGLFWYSGNCQSKKNGLSSPTKFWRIFTSLLLPWFQFWWEGCGH